MMDIKSAGRIPIAIEVRSVKKDSKTEASADRDPQQGHEGGEENPKRHLSEAELQAAVAHLKQLPGVKDSGLIVRLTKENGIVLVFVEDPTGKVIRRIPESELLGVGRTDKPKGNILDRAS